MSSKVISVKIYNLEFIVRSYSEIKVRSMKLGLHKVHRTSRKLQEYVAENFTGNLIHHGKDNNFVTSLKSFQNRMRKTHNLSEININEKITPRAFPTEGHLDP